MPNPNPHLTLNPYPSKLTPVNPSPSDTPTGGRSGARGVLEICTAQRESPTGSAEWRRPPLVCGGGWSGARPPQCLNPVGCHEKRTFSWPRRSLTMKKRPRTIKKDHGKKTMKKDHGKNDHEKRPWKKDHDAHPCSGGNALVSRRRQVGCAWRAAVRCLRVMKAAQGRVDRRIEEQAREGGGCGACAS